VKPGLLGRSCGLFASEVDRREAWACGRAAARAAVNLESGVMVAIRRDSDSPYSSSTFLTPLAEVAGQERLMPVDWIHPAGNDILPQFLDYARPLVGPIEHYPRFQ
jgi:6-phosphofructokinase 1